MFLVEIVPWEHLIKGVKWSFQTEALLISKIISGHSSSLRGRRRSYHLIVCASAAKRARVNIQRDENDKVRVYGAQFSPYTKPPQNPTTSPIPVSHPLLFSHISHFQKHLLDERWKINRLSVALCRGSAIFYVFFSGLKFFLQSNLSEFSPSKVK